MRLPSSREIVFGTTARTRIRTRILVCADRTRIPVESEFCSSRIRIPFRTLLGCLGLVVVVSFFSTIDMLQPDLTEVWNETHSFPHCRFFKRFKRVSSFNLPRVCVCVCAWVCSGVLLGWGPVLILTTCSGCVSVPSAAASFVLTPTRPSSAQKVPRSLFSSTALGERWHHGMRRRLTRFGARIRSNR